MGSGLSPSCLCPALPLPARAHRASTTPRSSDGMSPEDVRRLPITVYEKPAVAGLSGVGEACAICLEDYEDGEKLRTLPCLHMFHIGCIEQWLTSRRPLCPCCKHDASERIDSEEEWDETAPLLQPGREGAGQGVESRGVGGRRAGAARN